MLPLQPESVLEPRDDDTSEEPQEGQRSSVVLCSEAPVEGCKVVSYSSLSSEQIDLLKDMKLPSDGLDRVLLSNKPLPNEAAQQLCETQIQGVSIYASLADSVLGADDDLHTLNATLEKTDRANIIHSLEQLVPEGSWEPVSDGPFSGLSLGISGTRNQVYLPQGGENFHAAELVMSPDPVVLDLSTGFDFSRHRDRHYATQALERNPRFIVLNMFLRNCDGDAEVEHSRWACQFALTQYNQGRGFLVTKNRDHPFWSQGRVQMLLQLPDVEFTPLSVCNFGLLRSDNQNHESGILTNVKELTRKIQNESDVIRKQKGNKTIIYDNSHSLFSEVLKKLERDGCLEWRGSYSTWRTYSALPHNPRAELNASRIAQGIVDWIQSEVLAELDLSNHNHLIANYPSASTGVSSESIPLQEVDEDTTVTAGELLRQPGGEEFDSDTEEEDDHTAPTEKQKREIFKIHRGLGHPPPNDLGRALRHAGMKRHLVRWAVKELRCPVCEARVKPAAKRPGALPRCLKFNQVVGIDLVEFQDVGLDKILANMVCWGTGYQMACIIPDKTSLTTRNAFASSWIKHYGWPELVVTDQGPEFVGHEFSTYVGENGCLHHFIDSQSPWQQGRTERAGGSLKEDIRDVVEECAIVTDVDFEIALTQALDARNRYVDRSGFSAQQRVFGASLRLPGCLMAEDPIDRLALSSDPTTEFNRSAQIRDASQRALFRHKDNDAVKRAARARSRVKTHDDIKVGSVVYVWRNSSRSKFRGWVGPGLVVCLGPNGTSAWVSMRGVLVKTNMDRLRVATDSEWVGAELIKLLSADAKQHLERAGQRGYVDATAEEGPEDDEGASPPDPADRSFRPRKLCQTCRPHSRWQLFRKRMLSWSQ